MRESSKGKLLRIASDQQRTCRCGRGCWKHSRAGRGLYVGWYLQSLFRWAIAGESGGYGKEQGQHCTVSQHSFPHFSRIASTLLARQVVLSAFWVTLGWASSVVLGCDAISRHAESTILLGA